MTEVVGRILLISALLGAAPASAEVTIERTDWQLALQMRRQKRIYHDISQWLFPPSLQVKLRPRALVVLANKSGKAETAVLLRYSITPRLRRIGTSEEGIWTVPLVVEERRIPNLKGGQTKKIPLYLNRISFGAYLKRMYRAGYWPDALRIEVMVEPKPGETFEKRLRRSVLPILWKASAAKDRAHSP